MSGWLPPGCTDKDIDDAANGDPSRLVQCEECHKMFDPDEDEDCFVGWHRSYGDVCQCGECIQKARRDISFFCFSGNFSDE